MTHGSSIRGPRHAAASIAAMLTFVAALAGAPTVLAAPALDVSPSSGVLGAPVTATATDFPVDGPVTFRWDNGQLLGTATADALGTAELQFAIPAATTLGAHFVRACSTNKCPQGQVFADATVTVVAPTPPPTPVPTPTPTPTPTLAPTPRPTPTPRPPTPRPTTPGQTPGPGSTPIPPAPTPLPPPSGATSGASPSPDPGVSGSAVPSEPAAVSPSASADASVAPVVGPVASSTPAPLEAGPTAGPGGLGGLALPVGVLVVMLTAGILLVRLRSRVPPAAALPAAAEPDSFSARSDPVAPFLEQIPAGEPAPDPTAAQVVTLSPGGLPPTPPADPARRPRTISIHVEQIEADDL